MILDAKIEVLCDKEGCNDSIEVEPEYVYRDYSGKNGHYNTTDSAIETLLNREGWTVSDERQFCEACSDTDDDE